jgi:ABC-2 type transport system ATP-binding protein
MIEINNIRKSYGELVAVDDLSLSINDGEIFGLLGPNGAGKSTTISISCGLLNPDTGSVKINGLDPTSLASRKKLGLVPQSIALYEELTAMDNLSFFAQLYALDKNTQKQRIDWVLEFVGLSDRKKDLVKEYSGGMKRRLNLAASLLQDPDTIFMDEPTTGVDPQSRNRLFDSILGLKKLGKTIIYTTHYMEEAEKLCDRVGIIDAGKLLALDTVDNLINQHGGGSIIKLSSANGEKEFVSQDPAKDLLQELKHLDNINQLKLTKPDLETVFLNLTGRQLRDQ